MGSDDTARPTGAERPTPDRRAGLTRLLAFALAILALLLLLSALSTFLPSKGWGFDAEAYLAAAQRLARGDPIYQQYSLDGPYRPGPYGLYLYAPPFAVATLPFTALSVQSAEITWYLLRIGLLVAACAAMPVRPTIKCLIFAVAAITNPVLIDMNLGNVSVFVTCILAFVWRGLDRPLGAIALAIDMCVRPTLGLLLVWYALRRRWWPILWTLVTGLVIVLVTLPFAHIQGYYDYITVLRNLTGVTGQDNNLDLGSTVLRMGGGPLAASLALYGGYAVGLGAMLFSLRYDRDTSFMVTIGATLLLAPLLWDHYLAALLLPAAFLAQRGRSWGLGLPLLAWLPHEVLPLLAVAATLVPFIVRRPGDPSPWARRRLSGGPTSAGAPRSQDQTRDPTVVTGGA
jgi:Glycosyltransferase family 87